MVDSWRHEDMHKDLYPVGALLIARAGGPEWSRGSRAIVVAHHTHPVSILQLKYNKTLCGTLFQSGAYDEFSFNQMLRTFFVEVGPLPAVADYHFNSYADLVRDFRAGRFASAFT